MQRVAPAARDIAMMRLALRLARRGEGGASPNPMVGAVLARRGEILGRGWHRRAGGPHAEIEALRDAARRGHSPRGATLYVTLEPCCTRGRTPPCTDAIAAAGIRRVVAGATDPNPRHSGRAYRLLRRAGVAVAAGALAEECARLNEAFNHWIVRRTPFVLVKAAMTLDGKIATASGESKWITGAAARAAGRQLRRASDAILVGINTILADDPELTARGPGAPARRGGHALPRLRRIVLDPRARTPLTARVVADEFAALTTIVVGPHAPLRRVSALARRVNVLVAPVRRNPNLETRNSKSALLDLAWLLRKLGREGVTRLLVEGGGETNAAFLFGGFARRVAFFIAPSILGGKNARRAVAGSGAASRLELLRLTDACWRRLGPDWMLTAQVAARGRRGRVQPGNRS